MITEKGVVPIKGGQYKVLLKEQVYQLHSATVEVLENIGIKNLHGGAREIMAGCGCIVDHDKKNCQDTRNSFDEYLKKAPSRITLFGGILKDDGPS